MKARGPALLEVGRITGAYGVRGWVKVRSYTSPEDNVLRYQPWSVCVAGAWREMRVTDGRRHGKGVVAHLEGCDNRDDARRLTDAQVGVRRDQLAAAAPGEYYWADLIGLRVRTLAGLDLGVVDHLLETGANDVLAVRGERERLIPYLRPAVVVEVDLAQGAILVDWDPED